MSMNLHCNKYPIMQLPTYISYLIYSDNDGGTGGVLYRYEMYVRHLYQDTFNKLAGNEKRQKNVENMYEQILKDIDKMDANMDGLEFYIL